LFALPLVFFEFRLWTCGSSEKDNPRYVIEGKMVREHRTIWASHARSKSREEDVCDCCRVLKLSWGHIWKLNTKIGSMGIEGQTDVIDGKVSQRLSTTARASRFAKRRRSASSR